VNFKDKFEQRKTEMDVVILKYLPKEEGFSGKIRAALNYSMKSPGKRLRPMLMMETFQMFQGESEAIYPFMAAIEMIHTHSLIHDDLPAIDNDEYRRGRKTTHVVYGEPTAILAGDALLNYAYETAFSAFDEEASYPCVCQALTVLAKKTGVRGMLGGQSVDVINSKNPVEQEMLDYIYIHKTAALIEASMMIGAILAQAGANEISRMEAIGHNIGLAFQIQDDILDVTGASKELGKPLHSDEKNDKTTYVTLLGIEAARREVDRYTGMAVDNLLSMPGEKTFLVELLQFLSIRRK